MTTRFIVPALVALMLATGVCNTIMTKYQDMQCVRNCDSPDPKDHVVFEFPVLQTLQMFLGEMGCWLVVGISKLLTAYGNKRAASKTAPLLSQFAEDDERETLNPPPSAEEAYLIPPPRSAATGDDDDADADAASDDGNGGGDPKHTLRGLKILLLALPACCDITGTTLMNVGFLYVVASVYQMTRGALVLFVGLFSVLFLRRQLHLYQWFALVCVVAGVAIVGLAGAVHEDGGDVSGGMPAPVTAAEALRTVIGVLLIAAAQVFTASQFVLEEYILERYAMSPLRVVGWEGLFGFLVTLVGMVGLHFTIGVTPGGRQGYFDAVEGWHAMFSSRAILVSSLLIMLSIGGFNFFGISVTRCVSATSRSTIDTCRTLFIWVISLALGWESFKWLQVLGFGTLVYGTFLFNDIVRPPLEACFKDHHRREPHRELLPEEPIEHI